MRRRLILIVALAALAGLVTPSADAGHSFGAHWATPTIPFDVHFIDSASGSWDGVMQASAAKWSESDVLDVVIDPGESNKKTRRRCPPASGAVRICNFSYGNTGWVGLTVMVAKGKHIQKVAMKLNQTYLGRKNGKVMCHEMGHGLGLGHVSRSSSCMKQGQGASKTPNGHDYKMLRKIYDHTHAPAMTAQTSGSDSGTRVIKIPFTVEDYYGSKAKR